MPKRDLGLRAILLATAAIGCSAATSGAQGTARSMNIDISARSAALGGASTALPWGDLNHWANPALLGCVRGIRYVHGRTQLVPGLANDVIFSTDVVQAGGGGLGVLFSGKPLDRGGVLLDYGSSEGVDPSGNPTGVFHSYERVHALGAGVSAAQLAENALAILGTHVPRLSRCADVSVGVTSKHTEIVLGPPNATGTADSHDWGWLARVTPYDGLDTGELPVRLDATYGRSDINYRLDELAVFDNVTQAYPVTRERRRGAAVRGAAGRVPVDSREPGTVPLLLRGLTPLAAFTWTDDHADIGTLDVINHGTDGHGWELSIANVFSYRRGHYEDPSGGIDGDTWGWGVALPFGDLAGAAYDDAHSPQEVSSGLEPLHHQQVSVWIDPLAIWHATHVPSASRGTH